MNNIRALIGNSTTRQQAGDTARRAGGGGNLRDLLNQGEREEVEEVKREIAVTRQDEFNINHLIQEHSIMSRINNKDSSNEGDIFSRIKS
jgi:hypothetical protein